MDYEMSNNLNSFKEDIDEFDRAFKDLKKDFERVRGYIRALQNAWTGEAHDSLVSRFSEDQPRVEALLNYIDGLLKDYRYANEQYKNCESSVANMIASMKT